MQAMQPIHDVKVSVKTQFLQEQSDEHDNSFVFSYTITITNHANYAVKLLNRYWLISDANGDSSTVQGPGVIGKQPTIEGGKSFTYTSGCLLKTPVGTMQGHYQMTGENNEMGLVEIPVFRLAKPNLLN